MAVTFFKVVALLLLLYATNSPPMAAAEATWCVARSDASDEALQTALDYACAAGADCAPLESSSGLCYLPNTVHSHASYAFNSYYQRTGNAPGSCSFSGTATIATTDPSYGSCVYPSSPSTAGGMVAPRGTPVGTSTTTQGTTPAINEPSPAGTTTPLYGSTGGSNPRMGPTLPDTPTSNASPVNLSLNMIFSPVFFVLVFCCIIHVVYTMKI